MDILTIEEYKSLTDKPKFIRGHYFSLYKKHEYREKDLFGFSSSYWNITMVIDGKPYNFFCYAKPIYDTMCEQMQKVFENLV